jgi:hypothetical protein
VGNVGGVLWNSALTFCCRDREVQLWNSLSSFAVEIVLRLCAILVSSFAVEIVEIPPLSSVLIMSLLKHCHPRTFCCRNCGSVDVEIAGLLLWKLRCGCV